MTTAGKPIRCRAAVAWKPAAPLTLETIEVLPPEKGEVRIKILAASLCHTDVSKWLNNIFAEIPFPIVLGHEGVGIVESIGDGVTMVQPGDKVIPCPYGRCTKCECCLSSDYKPCKLTEFQPNSVLADGSTISRMMCNGQKLSHFFLTSTFIEYTVCPEWNVMKINADAPPEKVAPVGCTICTGIGSARNVAKVKKDSTVAIFGLGPIGLTCMMGAKQLGASTIIGVDILEWKFDIARRYGATHCVNPKDCKEGSIVDKIKEICPQGVDIAIECVGNVDVMHQAYESANRSWGRICILGGAPTGSRFCIEPLSLVFGKTVLGAAVGGCDQRKAVADLVEEFLAGSLDWSDLFTHTVKLEDINEAFRLNQSGESIKTLITI